MKKIVKKPVVWLIAAAVVGGGLTPVWADANTNTNSSSNTNSNKILASTIQEQEGFILVEQEQKDGKLYIKGKVREDVTKVVVLLPNDNTLEINTLSDQTFTAAVPTTVSDNGKTVTLLAYAELDLIDTYKLRIADDEEVKDDELVYALAHYDQAAGKLKVSGIVHPDVDEVQVSYGNETREAKVTQIWEGAKAFELLVATKASNEQEAVIKLYKDGQLIDEEDLDVVLINKPVETKPTVSVVGTALLSTKNKTVEIKGKLNWEGTKQEGKWKLYAIAPDGKKHELSLKKDFSFEGKLPFQNRSYSSKAVHLELYLDNTLMAKAEIQHGTPVNQPGPKQDKWDKWREKHEDKDKDKDKGKGKGKHDDDDDDDDDDEDED